ncbi:hypothetical protein DFH11DRAFT_1881573 [Phellopilus nigrolimitatus]|nr:hypothetical protein DFH11DRAFT_1881573 [Phellopilus nigrolimitatus]
MNHDVISGRNALTPVLNRDDTMQEWERRQAGKAAASQPYRQLEYVQQQAELAAAGLATWNQPRTAHRYPAQPSSLFQSYHPTANVVVDDPSERWEVVLSNPLKPTASAYAGNLAPGGARYGRSCAQQQQQQQQPASSFDAIDRGHADIANIYFSMQRDQY